MLTETGTGTETATEDIVVGHEILETTTTEAGNGIMKVTVTVIRAANEGTSLLTIRSVCWVGSLAFRPFPPLASG